MTVINCESSELTIVDIFSKDADRKFKHDFIKVCKEVFGENSMNELLFDRKYVNNIYGDSVLVVVYSGTRPVAARGLWRNDIDQVRSFQPVDTSVISDYRGKGIFELMTRKALERLGQKYLLYNFPNKNSFPLYLKLGWSLIGSYRPTVVSSFSGFACEESSYIDNDYLEWWFAPKKNHFFVCSTKQNSFLLRRAKYGMYFVIGTISLEEASLFVPLKCCPLIAINWTERQTFYNRNRIPLNVVLKSSGELNLRIPLYKMDFI